MGIKENFDKTKATLNSGVNIGVQVLTDIGQQAKNHGEILLKDNPTLAKVVDKVGEAVDDTKQTIGEVTDHITGEAALAEAKRFLDQQQRYNNILATRLAEALDRIAVLESRLDKLEGDK